MPRFPQRLYASAISEMVPWCRQPQWFTSCSRAGRGLSRATPGTFTAKELPSAIFAVPLMRASPSPFVAVFGLGGTIAMTRAPDGGVSPVLSASELLAAVPGVSDAEAELRVEDFRNKPGASLDFPDLYELAAAINRALNDGCVGAVVTQGTDTIEEVAYALDLLLPTDAPVVVTGRCATRRWPARTGPRTFLGGDVRDDVAVVAGGELGWLSGGACGIDAGHSQVAQVSMR
jgi:Asparaginase, N-terminal